MAHIVIGVDVGVTGAVAALDGTGRCTIVDLPIVEDHCGKRIPGRALLDVLRSLVPASDVATVIMEHIRVMAIPGRVMSHSTETRLVLARGAVQTVADVAGWPVRLVEPRVWKLAYGLRGKDRDPDAADNARDVAMRLYPALAGMLGRVKDHNRAEAVLIAHYGRERVIGGLEFAA
jgi:crossover junction endodeoxyribonuclease RuvC